MPDIINTPNNGNNSSMGWIVGLLIVVLAVILLLVVFPQIWNRQTTNNTLTPTETEGDMDDDEAGAFLPSPVINNTIINATSTTINSTTTVEE